MAVTYGPTGGNAAPGGRPGGPRYYNRASGRMETAKAMRGYRAPGRANARIAGATHAMGGPAAPQPKAPAQPKSTPYVHSLGLLYGFSPQEGRGIEQLLNSSQGARQRTELEPLQQKGREIQNTEKTVGERYGTATNNMNQLLSGLVTQSEGSAKTFENTAAENALAATRSVETAGQNAQTATGGYISPELRSILQSTGTQAQTLAQGGVNRANELGQANTNYMRQLAAAAAIGAGTGPGGGLATIANRYGTQLGQNRAAENQVLARGAARAKEERLTFPKELETERLARGKLEQAGEIGRARIGATERATTERGATARRGQNINRRSAQERNETTQRGQNLNRLSAKERNKITGERLGAQINHWNQQAAAKGGHKPITSNQANALGADLGSAYQTVRTMRDEGAPIKEAQESLNRGWYRAGGKTHKVIAVKDPILVRAAIELWNTHKVSAATRKLMGDKGMNIGSDQEAFEAVRGA